MISSGEGQLPEFPNGVFQLSRQRPQQAECVGCALTTKTEDKLNHLGIPLPVFQLNLEIVFSLLDKVMYLLQAQPEVT